MQQTGEPAALWRPIGAVLGRGGLAITALMPASCIIPAGRLRAGGESPANQPGRPVERLSAPGIGRLQPVAC